MNWLTGPSLTESLSRYAEGPEFAADRLDRCVNPTVSLGTYG
jgi:hypothetical protein